MICEKFVCKARHDLLTFIGNEQFKSLATRQVINQTSNQRWQLSIEVFFQDPLDLRALK